MSTRIKVVATLTARDGQVDALRTLLLGMAPKCRAEAGNLRWDVWQYHDTPGRFVIDELYVDDAAVASHRATEHYRDYASRIADLADRVVAVLDPVAVEP